MTASHKHMTQMNELQRETLHQSGLVEIEIVPRQTFIKRKTFYTFAPIMAC